MHHRIDSLTSIVALIAILGSHLLHDVSWLDPVGGLLVSMMVVRAGWGNTGNALLELADVGVAREIKDSVRKAAETALTEGSLTDGKIHGAEVEVQDIQGVKAGQNYLMNIEVAVPSGWSIQDTSKVEDIIRKKVGSKVRGVRRVGVRFVAKEAGIRDFSDEFIGRDISPTSDSEREGHDHTQLSPKGQVRKRH